VKLGVAITASGLTTWVRVADVPDKKLGSPAYCTLRRWVPAVRRRRRVVCWFAPKVSVPKRVVPSKKLTAPVGGSAVALTVAVSVMGKPVGAGLADEVRSTPTVCWLTGTATGVGVAGQEVRVAAVVRAELMAPGGE
jgi:hypothetical protein